MIKYGIKKTQLVILLGTKKPISLELFFSYGWKELYNMGVPIIKNGYQNLLELSKSSKSAGLGCEF